MTGVEKTDRRRRKYYMIIVLDYYNVLEYNGVKA
jgi:hypothetical protein